MESITVIIPVYNEAKNVAELCRRVPEALDALDRPWELLFIDDGSTDGTFEAITQAAGDRQRIRALSLRRNWGKSHALSLGFRRATGDILVTMDGDLQDDPRDIAKLLEGFGTGVDAVNGWKHRGKGPLGKALPSRVFNRVVGWITGTRLHDLNCPLKAYRREAARSLSLYGELHRFIPILLGWQGFTMSEVKVENYPRLHGVSKYGAERFMRGFLDLLTVKFLVDYSRRPLHFFGSIGMSFLGLGFLVNLAMSLTEIIWNIPIDVTVPVLLLGILLMVLGAIILCIGLIAELINHFLVRTIEECRVVERLHPAEGAPPARGEDSPASAGEPRASRGRRA